MSVVRQLAALGSTILVIGAGAASAFAVNIDTGAQPSATLKGLAPYRWWLVFGMTIAAVLLQAVGDLPGNSAADATKETPRRRHLIPRYLLPIGAWLIGVIAAILGLGFDNSWKQPGLYLISLAAIAIIIFIEYTLFIRFKSVIMVAEFTYAGSSSAAEEASAFRARVMEELADAVRFRHGRGGFQVRKLASRIDASDSDDRRRALAQARSSRCAVVIAGSVRQDAGEIGVTTAVLTSKRLGLGRPDEAPGRRILLKAPPEAVTEAKATTAAEAAAVAQLALGVAFFHRRRYLEAEDLLTSIRPENYLGLFYASYAAFARRDYKRASDLSLQSAGIKLWQPSLGIAAYSCFELGRNDEGHKLVSLLTEPVVERAMGPPWEEPVQMLPVMAAFRSAYVALDEGIKSVTRLEGQKNQLIRNYPHYVEAVTCHYRQDDEAALAALTPNMADPTTQDVALFAAAAATTGRPDAKVMVKHAESLVMPTPTSNDVVACGWLMEALAKLGDIEGAARVLRATLPLIDPESPFPNVQMLRVMHLSTIWDEPPIQKVLNEVGLEPE
jgi:hypothetical protein